MILSAENFAIQVFVEVFIVKSNLYFDFAGSLILEVVFGENLKSHFSLRFCQCQFSKMRLSLRLTKLKIQKMISTNLTEYAASEVLV